MAERSYAELIRLITPIEVIRRINFEGTSLRPGYKLRRSLTFHATSQGVRRNGSFPLVTRALPDLWLKPYWPIHFLFPAFAESLAVPRY
jgi:hypothetical protein